MELMTPEIAAKLIEADRAYMASDTGETSDTIVVKYFNPCGAQTWYIVAGTPLDAEGEPCHDNPEQADDWHLFGFCDLGFQGCAEVGYVMLSDLKAHRGRLGLGIERDLYYGEGNSLKAVIEDYNKANAA